MKTIVVLLTSFLHTSTANPLAGHFLKKKKKKEKKIKDAFSS